MKALLVGASLLVASLSQAADIGPVQHLQAVRVDSVKLETVGRGFPSTVVKVTATFSNACMVARASELVVIASYSKNYDDLILALGQQSNRACPANYAPVTVTINAGTYTKPNDGFFDTVTVNGVEAK